MLYTKRQLLRLRHSSLVEDPDENPAAVVWDWIHYLGQDDFTPDPIHALDTIAVQGHWNAPAAAENHPYASDQLSFAHTPLGKYRTIAIPRSGPLAKSSPRLRPQAQPFVPDISHLTNIRRTRILEAMAKHNPWTCNSPTRSHSTQNSLDLAMGQLTLKDSVDAHDATNVAPGSLVQQSYNRKMLNDVTNSPFPAHSNPPHGPNLIPHVDLHDPARPLPGSLHLLWGLEFGSCQNPSSNDTFKSPINGRSSANNHREFQGQQGSGSNSIGAQNQYDGSILASPPQSLTTTPFLPFTYRLKKGCWPQNDLHLLEFSALHIAERQTLDLMNTAEDVEAMSFCGCERAVLYRRSRALSLGLSLELYDTMFPFLYRALKGKWPVDDEEFGQFTISCKNGSQYALGRLNSYGICDCKAAVAIRQQVLERGERFDFMAANLEEFNLRLHPCYQVDNNCHQMGMPARSGGYMPNREHVEHAHALFKHQQLFGDGT